MDMLQVEIQSDAAVPQTMYTQAPKGLDPAHQIMYTQAPKGIVDPSTHQIMYTQAPLGVPQVVIIPGESCSSGQVFSI